MQRCGVVVAAGMAVLLALVAAGLDTASADDGPARGSAAARGPGAADHRAPSAATRWQVSDRIAPLPSTGPVVEPIVPGIQDAQRAPPATSGMRLSLLDAIEAGLDRNPDLQALRRNEGVSRGAFGVAKTYPFNPFIQVQATPLQDAKNAGPGTVYHYVLLMQQIQLAHQQRYREANAAALLTSVRWSIFQAELLNVAQTERLFFTALYQTELRDLARATAELNEQVLRVGERQLQAGQAAGADVAIIRMDARSSRRQARLAEANYQTALLDLRRQINFPLSVPLEPVGRLTDWAWRSPPVATRSDPARLTVDSVATSGGDGIAAIAAARPDVMAARADVVAARANADLARAARTPDVQFGPYYQRTENGSSFYGFRAHTDIPVMNNGLPLVRQREAEVRQRLAVWQQLHARAQIEAETAIDRYERARRIAEESRADFTEDLPIELERLERQFLAGEVDVVRVVTARTSLIQMRRAHLDTLNELAQATAGVTLATGLPAEALIWFPSPTSPRPNPRAANQEPR